MNNIKNKYSYYSVDDIELITFIRVLKILLTKEFKELNTESKLLYGILQDRASLSKQNGWIDKLGRVYIYFTINEIMDIFDCSKSTAVNLLSALVNFGLIEKKRQGQGKPTMLYVKNANCNILSTDKVQEIQKSKNQTSEIYTSKSSKEG